MSSESSQSESTLSESEVGSDSDYKPNEVKRPTKSKTRNSSTGSSQRRTVIEISSDDDQPSNPTQTSTTNRSSRNLKEPQKGNPQTKRDIIHVSSDSEDGATVQSRPAPKAAPTLLTAPPNLYTISVGDTVHMWDPTKVPGSLGSRRQLKLKVLEVRSKEDAQGGYALRLTGNYTRTLDQTVALPKVKDEQIYRALIKVRDYNLVPGNLEDNSTAISMSEHITDTERKIQEHAQEYVKKTYKRVKSKKTTSPQKTKNKNKTR